MLFLFSILFMFLLFINLTLGAKKKNSIPLMLYTDPNAWRYAMIYPINKPIDQFQSHEKNHKASVRDTNQEDIY
jgi:hypothetical protein